VEGVDDGGGHLVRLPDYHVVMVDDRGAERKTRSGGADDGADHDHILYLHEMLRRRVDRELPELIAGAGDPELRGSHRRILQLIPALGCRPTELAARARMTKQSIGELLAHLERHGYVTTSPDPDDRRAVRVRRTKAGQRAATRTSAAIRGLEDRWREEIGPARYRTFREVLAELIADDGIDPA
jgi:DNA-binding MarR family transcriptional regulator